MGILQELNYGYPKVKQGNKLICNLCYTNSVEKGKTVCKKCSKALTDLKIKKGIQEGKYRVIIGRIPNY